MKYGRTRAVTLLLAGVIASGMLTGTKARAAEGDPPPLTMEELEVRGRREKPERLYLSVPRGIRHSAPVRFDLLREDMAKPILPWEIESRSELAGGKRDNEFTPD
jgi:hypothetical protein